MARVKENKIIICQTYRILSMDLIYYISEYQDVTFSNDHTKIMYNAVFNLGLMLHVCVYVCSVRSVMCVW